MTRSLTFPDGFLWGTATSAYQIEGAVDLGGRGVSIWDTFSHEPGRVLNGETGDVAADHYHRFADDIALMGELGLQAYRFSIAWPRVIPDGTGAVNRQGLSFYDRLVDELLDTGIEPIVTLFHWDLPQSLQDEGGWRERDTAHAFTHYAEVVFDALRDRVMWWATHNEPWVAAYFGHHAGSFAPGIADLQTAMAAHHHLLLSHGLAVRAMRAIDSGPRQGIVLNLERAVALSAEPAVVDGARRVEGLLDRSFTDPIFHGHYPADVIADLAPGAFPTHDGDDAILATPIDWLGVNFYHPQFLAPAIGSESIAGAFPGCEAVIDSLAGRDSTDMGWPVEPQGLTDLLLWLKQRYPDLPPIVITENGCAYDDPMGTDGKIHDERRIAYFEGHLAALHEAIGAGVDVRGFMAWSLMDNFEWSSGYSKRFGLVHVDYTNQTRTPRNSAYWYRDVIEGNTLVIAE